MKLLWLCNIMPGVIQEAINGQAGGGLWLDHVLQDLRQQDMTIRVLCRGTGDAGTVDEKCSFATFREGLPYVYLPELEDDFCKELDAFQPDVIHVWGTEYGHSLAMVNAARKTGRIDRLVVNIQGLCTMIARHHNEGVPYAWQKTKSFRDFVRKDNLLQQQEKFALRGELEQQTLKGVKHVIGRTHWDRACTQLINPEIVYHHCDETLRSPFYEDSWRYAECKKHSIFAPGCSYPVKGFHYLLEAFAEVVKTYPDATLCLPGDGFPKDWKGKLRSTSYQNYLLSQIRKYGLEDKIRFLGSLGPEAMRSAYLSANAFVQPSTIENSPNTLGEAMLLGLPCIASNVGGVASLIKHPEEGFLYPSSATYLLAHYIKQIFAMEDQAEEMGLAAKQRAEQTHSPQKNTQTLLEIYRAIQK